MRKEEAVAADAEDPLRGYAKGSEWLLDSEGIALASVLQVRPACCAPSHVLQSSGSRE